MKFQELSLSDLPDITFNLSLLIKKDDISFKTIIYIERGGLLPGLLLSDILGVNAYGVLTKRKESKIKSLLKSLLPLFPKSFRLFLRKIELRKYDNLTTREISIEINPEKIKAPLLIIDDSIDSGNSMYGVIEALKTKLGNDLVYKIMVINTTNTNSVITPDFVLYKSTIIGFPWSNDSKEYQLFIELYRQHKSGNLLPNSLPAKLLQLSNNESKYLI